MKFESIGGDPRDISKFGIKPFFTNHKITISLTNTNSSGDIWIKINPIVNVVIDQYEPLHHIDIIFLDHNYACGGAGFARMYPTVFVDRYGVSVSPNDKIIDFYTLQPGEFEELALTTKCGEPGKYKYHFEVIANYGDSIKIIQSEQFDLLCPEYYSEWMKRDTENFLAYFGDSRLINRSNNDFKDYLYSESYTKYLNIHSYYNPPWTPCNDDLLSFIHIIFNHVYIDLPEDMYFPIYSRPGFNNDVIEYAFGKDVVNLADGPECVNNSVWWAIPIIKEGELVDFGWIPEQVDNKRVILPCFEKNECY